MGYYDMQYYYNNLKPPRAPKPPKPNKGLSVFLSSAAMVAVAGVAFAIGANINKPADDNIYQPPETVITDTMPSETLPTVEEGPTIIVEDWNETTTTTAPNILEFPVYSDPTTEYSAEFIIPTTTTTTTTIRTAPPTVFTTPAPSTQTTTVYTPPPTTTVTTPSTTYTTTYRAVPSTTQQTTRTTTTTTTTTATTTVPTKPVIEPYNALGVTGEELLACINKARNDNGVSNLSFGNYYMQNAALLRTDEIAVNFSHTRPDGRKFSTIFAETGVTYVYSGENLLNGSDQLSAQDMVDAWMASKTHKENILNSKYTYTNFGIVYRDGMVYCTEHFIGY